ncbi:MAG TPA: choice-of-anchor J domain-containing protein, partial [Bacteroidales bacterium]|nr:choice-of-anchor J domain-containing protein [Bacteroidales bacterium]
YTAFWGTNGKFGKYTLAGEFIETFIIANVGGIRDLTYDGTYFYGGGGATTIYKLDFAKKTLEGTITSPVNVRHLSYDPVEDAFWCGDWTSLRLVSRAGTTLVTGTTLVSVYGSAYDGYSEGGPYLWFFSQTAVAGYGTEDDRVMIQQYNIATNSITGVFHCAIDIPGYQTGGIAGGAFATDLLIPGKYVLMVNVQNTPNLVGVYELENTGNWLDLSAYNGVIQPTDDQDIQVNFNTAGLEEGTYNATIKITHDGQNVTKGLVEIPVTMHVYPPCPKPVDLTVDNITQTSAVLNWTAIGNETTWNLKYGAPGFDPETEGTLVGGITKPYLLGGLNHSTDYAFRVQAVCDVKELSNWSKEKVFSTLCGANELPFVEDFEGVGFPPKCWNIYDLDGGGTQWVVSSAQNHTPGGSKSAYHQWASGDQDGWLVTPQIQLPEDLDINLSFWSFNLYPGDYGKNSVLISTGSGDPDDEEFELLWSPETVTQPWEETLIPLTDYAGEDVYIAFRYTGDNAHGWYVDDVQVFVPGNVEGYVSEATSPKNRTPIEGARVFTAHYEAFTDASGYYKLEGLPAGIYDISCEAEGYFISIEENFEIVEDDTKSLNFTLDYAQIAVNPDEFDVVLPHESIKIEKLTISNPNGTAPLTWNASMLFSRRSYTVHPVPEGETKFIEANLAQANSIPGGAPRENLTRDDEIVLHYDGDNDSAIGANGEELSFAARFPSAMVAQYAGFSLEYVDVYIWDVPFGSTLMIWGAGTTTEPGTLLYQQEFEAVEEWNTINLDEPLLLDGTDIWVGYHVEYDAGEYPGGCDEGPADPDGAWVFINGGWYRLYELDPDLDYNWNIRAYLLPPSGSWLSISPKSGVVPVGGSSEITVSFNSAGLEEGDYHATIKVNHDGQEVGKGVVNVPVTMGVYPHCRKPKDLTATLVNPTDFELGWTPMGETSVFNVILTDDAAFEIGGAIDPYDSFEGIEDNLLFIEDLQPETDYWFYVQADCGEAELNAPEVDRFWLDINTQGNIVPANSGGTANEPGEDGTWRLYTDTVTGQSYYSIWFYNSPLDMYGMNKMKMGFYVQKSNPIAAANVSFVVSYSTPDWDPDTTGFPMPDDEEFILRSPANGPYILTVTGQNKQWFELEFDIPDYNPEWISVSIIGSNIKIA